jgi:thiamine biosynthesis lipoprotein
MNTRIDPNAAVGRNISRRRFLTISAAGFGLPLLPPRAYAEAHIVSWSGSVLGASASLRINHPDRRAAERLIARATSEVRRLERILSLYREDSSLITLNRTGILVAPPPELLELLSACRRYYELTNGAFDPTVQPLWNLYFGHFSRLGADPAGPPQGEVKAALQQVGFHQVLAGRDRIVFARRGMAITLNGIAQGYVTDRVVELLRSEGIDHSLVDMGEIRALGGRPEGGPWQIGIQDADDADQLDERLNITDGAVATSGSYGFRFDREGRFNHLFDPSTGQCATAYRSVTVVLPTATAADALSTAFSLMPPAAISAALAKEAAGKVHLTTCAGERQVIS